MPKICEPLPFYFHPVGSDSGGFFFAWCSPGACLVLAWCWSARDVQLITARGAWRMSHETYGLVPGPFARLSDPFARPSRQAITPGHHARPSRQAITPGRRIHRADVHQAVGSIAPMFTRPSDPSRQAIGSIAPGHHARPSDPSRRCSPGHRARLSDSSRLARLLMQRLGRSPGPRGRPSRIRAPWPEGPRARLGERFQWVSEIFPRILAPGGRGGGSGLVSLK